MADNNKSTEGLGPDVAIIAELQAIRDNAQDVVDAANRLIDDYGGREGSGGLWLVLVPLVVNILVDIVSR